MICFADNILSFDSIRFLEYRKWIQNMHYLGISSAHFREWNYTALQNWEALIALEAKLKILLYIFISLYLFFTEMIDFPHNTWL